MATDTLWGAQGDIVYATGDNAATTLAIGSDGYVLQSDGSLPTWAASSGVGYTQGARVYGTAVAIANDTIVALNFTGERYDKYFDHGHVDFFWTDVLNFDLYEDSRTFFGYDLNERIGELDLEMLLPRESIYHGVISNEFSDLAMKTVNITVTVESYLDLEIIEPDTGTEFKMKEWNWRSSEEGLNRE